MDAFKFICPKCAHDRVRSIVGSGMMRCDKCHFKAVPSSFRLEKRPSLKWDEAVERRAED